MTFWLFWNKLHFKKLTAVKSYLLATFGVFLDFFAKQFIHFIKRDTNNTENKSLHIFNKNMNGPLKKLMHSYWEICQEEQDSNMLEAHMLLAEVRINEQQGNPVKATMVWVGIKEDTFIRALEYLSFVKCWFRLTRQFETLGSWQRSLNLCSGGGQIKSSTRQNRKHITSCQVL